MEKEYSELIIGYIQKKLSVEELNRFYQWVNESSENKKIFFEVKSLYEACAFSAKEKDINKSWNSLLEKRTKVHSRKIHSLFVKLSFVAAILVLMVVVSSLFLRNTNNDIVTSEFVSGLGGKADLIILPDSSKVYMGSQTIFSYDVNYGDKKRIVYLEGKAYFEVAKKKNKPFIVKTKAQSIEALGTKFNVVAYPNDSLSVTTLVEGSLRLTSKNSSTSAILKPDQQLTYNLLSKKIVVRKVDAKNELGWIEGLYRFTDITLKDLLHHLGHYYNITFEIHSEELANHKFSGTIQYGKNIKEVLKIINISIPIRYEQTERHIEIFLNN